MKVRLTHPRSQAMLPVQLQGKSLLVSLEMSDVMPLNARNEGLWTPI